MKMQVYTFPYPHSTIRRGVEGSSQAIRSGMTADNLRTAFVAHQYGLLFGLELSCGQL